MTEIEAAHRAEWGCWGGRQPGDWGDLESRGDRRVQKKSLGGTWENMAIFVPDLERCLRNPEKKSEFVMEYVRRGMIARPAIFSFFTEEEVVDPSVQACDCGSCLPFVVFMRRMVEVRAVRSRWPARTEAAKKRTFRDFEIKGVRQSNLSTTPL